MSIMALRTRRSLARMPAESFPLSLHVYRVGGIWGEDKIIKADDKTTPRYYLKGTRIAGSWQFALHVGGPGGMPLCHVKSPYLGPPILATDPGPISISIGVGSEQHAVQVQRGKGPDGTYSYSFKGFDDCVYRWQQSSGRWGNKMECLNSQDQVVATYRITLFAVSKDGELRVHQAVQPMADLIVATCLAMRTPDH